MAQEWLNKSALEEILLCADNIPVLEEVINSLHKHKDDLSYKPLIGYDRRASAHFLDVAQVVDDFLDHDRVEPRSVGPFSIIPTSICDVEKMRLLSIYIIAGINIGTNMIALPVLIAAASLHHRMRGPNFHRFSRRINIDNMPYEKAIPIIAHEYAHCIQHEHMPTLGYRAFREGHALGVERHAAKVFGERHASSAFNKHIDGWHIGTLCDAYKWTTRRLGVSGSAAINDMPSPHRHTKRICSYCLGNAVFSIKEALVGPHIYAQALKDSSIIAS